MSIDEKPKVFTLPNILSAINTVFILAATIAIAWTSHGTYSEMKKDYQTRTRPYIQIDFVPNENRIYLENYGQIFAKNVSCKIYEFRNNEWKNVGTVTNMAIMPKEKRSVDFYHKISTFSRSTINEIKKSEVINQTFEKQTKPVEKVKFEVVYQGVDKKEFHTSRMFSCELKQESNKVTFLYASQDDIVD